MFQANEAKLSVAEISKWNKDLLLVDSHKGTHASAEIQSQQYWLNFTSLGDKNIYIRIASIS